MDSSQLHIMQNGYIDFKKNREQYRAARGLSELQEYDSQHRSNIDQKDVEDNFVMLESKVKAQPNKIRRSHIVRQMEEGSLGIRQEDYDDDGNLNFQRFE